MSTHGSEVEAFFNDIDVDKSGKLDIAELVRLFGPNADAVAAELDGMGNGGNGDGVISLDELQNFFDNIKKNTDAAGKSGEEAVTKALKGLRITLAKAPPVEPKKEAPAAEAPAAEAPAAEEPAPAAEEPAPAAAAPAAAEPSTEEKAAADAADVAAIPDDADTNKAATSLQNLKRAKDAKAKVAAKRAELAALEAEDKKDDEDIAAAEAAVIAEGGDINAEVVDIPDDADTNKAATSLQNLKRAKDAKAKVAAKREEVAAQLKKDEEEAAAIAASIPDDAETNKAATSLQNLKRGKDAKAKVAAKRAELAALEAEDKKDDEDIKAAEEAVVAEGGDINAEAVDIPDDADTNKAATSLQNLKRAKDAKAKVAAKRAEVAAQLAAAEADAAAEAPADAPPAGAEEAGASPRVAQQIAEAKALDEKLNAGEGEAAAPAEEAAAPAE
ncbi:hypothetical protein TeGR_g4801 [Tetraparma gracilis]|uniref:EF-hand domain-containing protein n=1 Tax=Tetraparma gracilis TaxID=2962635 RepID=A0ABQ6MKQ2_9STRA|nr:hypothetical protein TeGR_g4801 [Tetraparma gracilis]